MDDYTSRLHAFELLLDSSVYASEPFVELNSLRRLVARGIPSHPPHLRPLAYTLLLGSLPVKKSEWKSTSQEKRKRYYALVEGVMEEVAKSLGGEESESESRATSTSRDHERDSLISAISEDVDSILARHPYLSRRSQPGKTNPLRPVSNDDTGDSTSSDEDSSETDTKNNLASIPTLKNRRALFERIDWLSEVDAHRTTSRYSAEEKGKGRGDPVQELAVPGSESNQTTPFSPPLTSPAIVLSQSDSDDVTPPESRETATGKKVNGNGNGNEHAIPGSLSVDTSIDHADTPSSSDPIKLLSPQQLRSNQIGMADMHRRQEDKMGTADTHSESILRLLFIFGVAEKQWGYDPALVDIVRVLYTIFASGGDVDRFVQEPKGKKEGRSNGKGTTSTRTGTDAAEKEDVENGNSVNRWSRHAEAETFWALTALMEDIGSIIVRPAADGSDVTDESKDLMWALKSFRRRLRWADYTLHDALVDISLTPTSAEYAQRWITTMFASDLSIDHLLPLWDFLLSEPPITVDRSPRADVLVDICTAMVLLLKGPLMGLPSNQRRASTSASRDRSLWGSADGPEMQDVFTGSPSFAKALALLDDYPIGQVGTSEILRVAWEIRQRQALAALGGTSPVEPIDEPSSSAFSNLLSRASTTLRKKLPSGPTIDYDQLKSNISENEHALRQYTASLQDSDAAAKMFKVSSNLTAAALARWSSTKQTSSTITEPAPTSADNIAAGWTASASKWFGAGQSGTSTIDEEGSSASDGAEDKFTELPPRLASPSHSRQQSITEQEPVPSPLKSNPNLGANLYRRDTNLPPSFISHRGSIVYPAGRYRPKQRALGADGSDGPKVSIQSRLAGLAATASATELIPPVPALRSVSPTRSPKVRPLILSSSAKPASPHTASHSLRRSSDTQSSPHSARSSSHLDGNGYGSPRVSTRNRDSATPDSKRQSADAATLSRLQRNGVKDTSARLRAVTGHARRATEGGDSPADSEVTRYNLTDPGPGQDGDSQNRDASSPDGMDHSDSPSSQVTEEDGIRKYRLTDTPTPQHTRSEASDQLNRSDSGGSQHSLPSNLQITRRIGVKKGRFGRGSTDLTNKLPSKRNSTQEVADGLPSPLPEESFDNKDQVLDRKVTSGSTKSARSDDDRAPYAAKVGKDKHEDGYGDLLESYALLEHL